MINDNNALEKPRHLRRRVGILLAAGLLVCAVAFWGFRRWSAAAPELTQFHKVKRGDMLISIVEGGALRAVKESIIRSEFEGISRIISIVSEGTYVKQGQILVELDSSELKDRVNQQEVTYQNNDFAFIQAKENLSIQQSLAESQIKEAELRVEFAKSDLDKYIEGDAPQQVNTATNAIIIRKEQLQRAQDKLDWTQQLFKKGYASKSELEADGLSLMQSKIALEQSEEDLRLFRKYDLPKSQRRLESTWEQAKMELARLGHRTSNQLAQAEANLRTSQRALELTQEKLKELKQQLENSKIKAPQDGLVVYASSAFGDRGQMLIEEGAQVRQRQEIIKLPDVSQMIVEIRVHESHVLQIRPGLEAYVTVDSIPDRRFKAKVIKVAVLPNSQDRWMNPNLKVYSTDVLIEEELPDLKPGASARAEIVVTNLLDALTVPLQSVTTVKGKQVCYVQQGNELAAIPVTVGNFNDQFIEIRAGLKEGDQVALTPPANASEDLDLSGSVLSTGEPRPNPATAAKEKLHHRFEVMSRRSLRFPNVGIKWLGVALAVGGAVYLARVLLHRSQKVLYPPNAFYQVKREDMLVSIVEEGALRALNETVIRSGLEGLNRVIHLTPEGSQVKKGDLLVELDSAGLKDRLNEQELSYQDRLFQMLQATASLKIQKSLAESQIKEAELLVENAQSDLEKYRDGDAPLLIRTVEARSGVLAEQVRIATERDARTQELFKTGNASRSELEADALSLKREQLGLSQYQEDLRLIKKFDQPKQVRLLESKVTQAQAELERLKHRTSNEIAQAEADLRTSQRSVDVLEESLKTQKQRLENAKIYAPQDGLVVFASVSPFQLMGGDDRRRDEGRFRGGRGGGGPGGGGRGDGTGEFRGGGRRGGRFGSESNPSGSSSSSSSTAETISAGHQRIASAISGTAATQPGSTAGGGGGNSSSGGRGSESGAGAGSGQNAGAASANSGFVSYPSMRPSSSFGTSNSPSSGSSGSAAGTSGSSSASNVQASITPQFGFRSSSQNASYFSGFESYGAPTVLEEGMMVRQRQELIRLPDASKMVAEIKIHESRVGQVRAGMTAYVRIDSIPDRRFKGTVRRVAPLPDSQMSWMSPNLKVFPTDVLIEEELPTLRPGVSARAEVIITNLSKVLSVPIQAVTRFRGENVCFVKKGAGVAPVPVTTGWFNDQFVEVISGLKEGHQVLLAPIGDEAIEESGETNEVDSATEPPARPLPASEDAPAEERRMQRRNSDSTDGDAPRERRRNRPDPAGPPPHSPEAKP